MAPTPGWYPDPSGDPDQLRYWDGALWTNQVRPHTQRRGTTPALLAIVLLLVAAVVAWQVLRPGGGAMVEESTDSSTPTVSGWDEQSSPTSGPTASGSGTPSPEPSKALEVACPRVTNQRGLHPSDGRYRGGGLVVDAPTGFSQREVGFAFFLDDRDGGTRPTAGSTWLSFVAVGKVSRANFPTIQAAARQVTQCHTSSASFPGKTSLVETHNAAHDVGGRKGWRSTSTFGSTDAPGGGARFDTVVVDLGDPDHLSVYWTGVTLADTDAKKAVDAVLPTLGLE